MQCSGAEPEQVQHQVRVHPTAVGFVLLTGSSKDYATFTIQMHVGEPRERNLDLT